MNKTTPASAKDNRWILASLSLTMLLPSLGTSIANIALPSLAETFGAPFQQIQWVVLSYLLAITVSIVSVGRLGDMFGRRRMLLIGLGIFIAGSAACAVAPNLAILIAARVIQGVGAALMMALTMAMVSEAVPKERTGSAMGLLATMSAIGTALGPSLGGALIHYAGWSSIFLINVPVGTITLALAAKVLPRPRLAMVNARGGFDYAGTAVLAIGLGTFCLAMTLGRGNFSLLNLGLVVLAVAAGLWFVHQQSQSPAPLVKLEVLRQWKFSSSFAMSILIATVVMASLVVGPFYLSISLGLPPTQVGLLMATGPLVAAVVGIPAGRLVDRFGASHIACAGLYCIGLGAANLSLLPFGESRLAYVVPLVMITAGYGLFQAANNTAVMADVPPDQRGVISGVLTLSRNLGLISGASVMGAVFALGSGTSDFTQAQPNDVTSGLRLTYAMATVLVIVAILITKAAEWAAYRANHPNWRTE